MKVSNKVLMKILLLSIIGVFITGLIFIGVLISYHDTEYKYDLYRSSESYINETYKKELSNPRLANYDFYLANYIAKGYDLNEDEIVSYKEFEFVQKDRYLNSAEGHLFNFKLYIAVEIIVFISFIIIVICIIKYFLKLTKLTKHIKKYRNFILATNNNSLEDISKEFGENIEIVEANIQKAIDKHILKNVYLLKQTKEILLIDNVSANKKVKGNIQNVNVENNVIINEKGEEKDE